MTTHKLSPEAEKKRDELAEYYSTNGGWPLIADEVDPRESVAVCEGFHAGYLFAKEEGQAEIERYKKALSFAVTCVRSGEMIHDEELDAILNGEKGEG